MKLLVVSVLLVSLALTGCQKSIEPVNQSIQQSIQPNQSVIAVGTKAESAYVPSDNLFDWLNVHRPDQFRQGQISRFKIDGIEIAVSVPHVVNTPEWSHPLPKSVWIGPWVDSSDGREISFARIINGIKFGFLGEAIEATEPQEGDAILKTVLFDGDSFAMLSLSIGGKLEIVRDLRTLADFTASRDPTSAACDRLTRRATQKFILTFVVPSDVWDNLPGTSGALVWQNDRPVGVFIARLNLEQPTLLIEPLVESLKSTWPVLR